MHVLLIEDDDLVAAGIQAGLADYDILVDRVANLDAARAAMRAFSSDVAVLDLALPDGDGLHLLEEWRAAGVATPVLILTARDAIGDRVRGLQRGADDYLLKPFDLDELAARLQALVRRVAGRSRALIEHGPLRLDPLARRLTLDGREISLPRRELMLLEVFLQAPDSVLSADRIKDRLYGMNDDIESNALNVHIHFLRRKLGSGVIETVRGLGYRLGDPAAIGAGQRGQ